MRAASLGAALLLAAGLGFLAGRWSAGEEGGRGPDRAETGREAGRARVEVAPDEFVEWQKRVAQVEALEAENRRLQERLAGAAPARDPGDEGLQPGTRRADGTIVGGAAWPEGTKTMAVGFLGNFLERFFDEANLTPLQRKKLRAELETRIGDAMQIAADTVNGDISGDEAYDRLSKMAEKGRATVKEIVDAQQFEVYEKFERGVGDFVRMNVVSTELTGLRTELGLDTEQERNVQRVLEARYQRVQQRLGAPIQNMFFRPLRRDSDRDIYDETAAEIASYLRPDQAPLFAEADKEAATAVHDFRRLLVPK